MKPGDIVTWYYKQRLCDDVSVFRDDELYSHIMCKWVSIGFISTIIYVDNCRYCWVNERGIFSARWRDIDARRPGKDGHCHRVQVKVL